MEYLEPKLLMSTVTWANASGHANWSDASAWVGGIAPTSADAVIFPSATTIVTPNLTGAANVAGITIDNSGADYSITQSGSQTLTVGSGGISVSTPTSTTADTTTIAPNITFSADQTWTTTNNTGLTTLVASGIVSGTNALTKAGTGVLTLSGASNYTGNTTVSGGRMVLQNMGAYASALTTVNSGATLEWNVTSAASAVGGTAYTGAGVIQKTGSGVLTIGSSGAVTANLSAGGVLDIQAGDLNIGGGYGFQASNLGSLNVASGAAYHTSDGYFQIDALTGGGLVNNGSNSTTPYIFAGISGTQNNSTYGVSGNTATFSGIIGQTQTYNGVSVGSLNIFKFGSGTQILTGANGYSGVTAIVGGSLQIGNGTTDGSIASTALIVNYANLTYNLVGSQTYANVITGSGSLTKNGPGTLVLTGASDYTGATTINNGTFEISDDTVFNSPVTVNSPGVFDVYSTQNFASRPVYSQTLSGNGTVNKTGTGYFTLSGAVDLSGQINVQSGILGNNDFTADWSGDTASLDISSGAYLDLAGNSVDVDALTGSGTVADSNGDNGPNTVTTGEDGGGGTFSGDVTNTADSSGQGASTTGTPIVYTADVGSGNQKYTAASAPSLQYWFIQIPGSTLAQGLSTMSDSGTASIQPSLAVVNHPDWAIVRANTWQAAAATVLVANANGYSNTHQYGYTYDPGRFEITTAVNTGLSDAQYMTDGEIPEGSLFAPEGLFSGYPALEKSQQLMVFEDGWDYDFNDAFFKLNVQRLEDVCVPCLNALAQGGSSSTQLAGGDTGQGTYYSAADAPGGGTISNASITSPGAAQGQTYDNQIDILASDQGTASDPKLIVAQGSGLQEIFVRTGVDPTNSNLIDYASTAPGSKTKLVHNLSAATFVFSDADGNEIDDSDYSGSNPLLQGVETQATGPNGISSVANTYDSSGRLTETRTQTDSSGNGLSSTVYSYITSGAGAGEVGTTTLRTSSNAGSTWTVNRVTTYTYYGSGDPNGTVGSIETQTIDDGSSNTLDTTYYRYYTSDSATGYTGGLKYQFGTVAYARLLAAGLSTSSSDADVAPYADLYMEYDGQQRVTKRVVQGEGCSACSGGLGTYTYTYTSNPSPINTDKTNDPYSFNVWTDKLTETLPDGTVNTMYSDAAGYTMLSITATGGNQWIDYYRYDAAGDLILHANPSAVTGYDDTYADLVHYVSGNAQYLSDSTGLIEVTDYYGSTTATVSTANTINIGTVTAGGAAGYVEDTKVQNGETGTPILQTATTYFGHEDANGAVVFFDAQDTQYRNTNGTGGEVTTNGYVFFTGTNQYQQMTVSNPVVGSGQNGPGTADVSTTVYNALGQEIWSKDADGFINYTAYDTATGAVVKQIQDVDTSLTSEFTALPSGWSTPTGGGLNLITTYAVDTLGRTVEMTSPNGNVTYTLYDDVNHAVFTFSGVTETVDGSGDGILTTTGPISMTRTQVPYTYSYHGGTVAGTYDETMTFSGTVIVSAYTLDLPGFTQGGGATSGFANVLNLIGVGSSGSPQFTVQTLSRTLYNAASQVIESDDYASISNSTYLATAINSPYSGTLNTNYYATTYGYSDRGWQDHTIDPTGTITDTFYDGLGRVVGTYVGTDDSTTDGHVWNLSNTSSTNNMTEVSSDVYDNGGVGDGNLTSTTQYVDGTSGDNRVSQMLYDFRDRMVASKSGAASSLGSETDGVGRPITVSTLDNLGEAIANFTFDGDGIALSDFASGVSTTTSGGHTVATVDASALRGYSTTSYDDQVRTYQGATYSVDPTTGYISANALTSNTYYDHRGDIIEQTSPTGLVSKMTYDGAGRTVMMYSTDGGAVNNSGVPLTTWSAANSVVNDIVLEQTATGYDADGNAVQTADAQRFNTDPTSGGTSKGALFTATTNSDGSLNVTPSGSSYLASRIYYTGTYYDAGDRDVADVNVGDNGGSTWSRPSSIPSRSDTVLVTSTAYNAAGWVDGVTDPRGIASQMIYDNLGRTIISVAAYDPTVSGGSPTDDQNQTTVYTYDPAGHTTSMTAYLPSAIQQTQYIYGVTTSGGSTIDSNDLLALVEYPDKSTGLASTSASDQNSFTYNAAGQVLTKTDQNGTVHTYTYDVLGRQTSDAVTIASGNPQNVDTSVLRIATNYDSQGNLYQTTSYNATSGGSIVNQVQNEYNGLGQLTAQYQAVSGAVNTSTTPVVQYAYSDPSLGSKIVSMTYPNGRILHYGYDSTTLDSAIGRLSYLADDNGSGGVGSHLQNYQYLGLSTVVSQADGDGITLTYIHQSGDTLAIADGGDQYTGLDRFGRVSDQNYVNVSTSTSTDRFQYGYDRDGNVLYKNNLVNSADSELYHANSSASGDNSTAYDPLNRLVSYQRGTLSSSGNNGSSLDTVTTNTASQSYALDAIGNMSSVTTNGGTPQSRSANSQNQYTTVGGNSMTYDDNGNTTTDETGKQYVYDAWNRLVAVKDTAGSGGATLETFTYDGQGYRFTDTVVSTSTTTALYYSAQWQVLEERQSGTTTTQYVWSPTYVDAMILRDSNATSGSLGISGSGLGQRLYVQQDANFNVTTIVNTSGAVQERYIYDPYGSFAVLNSSWSAVSGNISAFGWIYLHQGGRYDSTSGLYDFRNRQYSPTIQRWTQQEPSGSRYIDGNDLYEYARDNPAEFNDPSGLDPLSGPAEAQLAYFRGGVTDFYFSDGGKMVAELRGSSQIQQDAKDNQDTAEAVMIHALGGPTGPDVSIASGPNIGPLNKSDKFGLLDSGYYLDGMIHGYTVKIQGKLTNLSKTCAKGSYKYKATYSRDWSIDKTFMWHSHGWPGIGPIEDFIGSLHPALHFYISWHDNLELEISLPSSKK